MPRADAGYPHNFEVSSEVFKDAESENEAKTNSRRRVCPLLVSSPLLACTEHAQSLLFAHYVNTPHTISTVDQILIDGVSLKRCLHGRRWSCDLVSNCNRQSLLLVISDPMCVCVRARNLENE